MMDKENIRFKVKSKIPLPTEPLPPIPQTLLKRLNMEIGRQPLKTINLVQNNKVSVAGTYTKNEKLEKVKPETKCRVKIDTRHVSVRKNTEHLDLERNCLGDTKRAVTPAVTSLEPNTLRNINKSLKRPHSRELQGLSPVERHERGDERHKRRLFNERLQDNLQSSDFHTNFDTAWLNLHYSTDLFAHLLNTEHKTITPKISSKTRASIINWMITLNGINGNPAVVQSALWYLDSVSAVCVELEKLQVVAAACYWIAQKAHGQVLTAKRLVTYSGQAFTAHKLLAAEKSVLYKLNFPPLPVVPQEFITYLSWWCGTLHKDEIEAAATFLCVAGLMADTILCDEYPSVIAAAAIRNAVLLLKKEEAIKRLEMNSVFKEVEKKATNISYVCFLQRRAVRYISSIFYEYRAPLKYYDAPPHYAARKIVTSTNELTMKE